MKLFYNFLLIIIITILSALILLSKIDLSVFTGVSIIWLFAYIIIAGGVESIIELTAGKLSIKRSVKEAQAANLETQRIRDELKAITKANAENAWILASISMLAAGGDTKARERLEKNLTVLSEFVEADKAKEDKWWEELGDLFPERRRKK
jgi:hypothetical protein